MEKIIKILLVVGVAGFAFFDGTKIYGMWQNHLESYFESVPESYIEKQPLQGIIDDFFSENLLLLEETIFYYQRLSDEQKAGMVLMPAYDNTTDIVKVKNWIHQKHIGGVMLLKSGIQKTEVDQIRSFNAQLPLLLASDAEPSLMQYRFPGMSGFIKTNSIATVKESETQAEKIALLLKHIGVNINFAPVYDNDNNTTVIGNRSFGESHANIQKLANIFANKTKELGVIPTAKHFPGHGSVTGDTHKSLETIKGSLTELDNFTSGIENNIPIIMVGHLAVQSDNADIDTNGLPATLSRKITTDILQKELDFKGLIVTDAMNMHALSGFEDADIRALEAGIDILLMPRDIEKTYNAILEKIKTDSEFKNLINKKVFKIIKLKMVLQKLK